MRNKLVKLFHNIALSLKGALVKAGCRNAHSFRSCSQGWRNGAGDASVMLNAEVASPEKPITSDYEQHGDSL